MASEWTRDWPTEPGWYWFYGWAYGRITRANGNPEAPRLEAAQVHQAGSGSGQHLMHIRTGQFMYKSEGAIGLWLPMDVPELPELEAPDGE